MQRSTRQQGDSVERWVAGEGVIVPLHVLILAAGRGTRMQSRLPKVCHSVAGRPLLSHVAAAASELEPDLMLVVVPADGDAVRAALKGYAVEFIVQDPPRGTADAVVQGCAALEGRAGHLVVVNGDCPGLRGSTLRRLVEEHGDRDATFLTVKPNDPTGYGRVIRDDAGKALRIVEEADATREQLALREANGGLYVFSLTVIREVLSDVDDENAQRESYLTSAFEMFRARGLDVGVYLHPDGEEVHGVNTRAELARAETLLQERTLHRLMDEGVTLRNPATVMADVEVIVGPDTVLYPGVTLETGTRIGRDCILYPNVRVARSTIGDGVNVWDGSVIEDCVVEARASIGPYARLRPGAEIGAGAKIGNFVEVKKSRIGAGSKASHLTYLGDAEIGPGVNVGAGTITCNYDGMDKHLTRIEEGAFIGSNTAIVAPVTIGAGAYVGAGSTITKDIPPGDLAVTRGPQTNVKGWADARAKKPSSEPAGVQPRPRREKG